MVRQDILGGLRIATAKGESLKRAMTTLYNSGYPLKEIEEAAQVLQNEIHEQKVELKFNVPSASKPQTSAPATEKPLAVSSPQTKPKPQIQTIKPKVSDYGQQTMPPAPAQNIPQKISQYEQQAKPKRKIWLLLGIIFVLILIGFVTGFILFEEEIINFFKNMF